MTDPDRVQAVADTGLLDGAPDAVFDRVARLASALVQAPVSFVTLVAGDYQVMPGAVRPDEPADGGRRLPLDQSFCPFAVATGEPVVIDDARRSALVGATEPARRGSISSYAGLPLRTSAGHVLGTLCVLDRTPRNWSEQDLALLDDLAALAVHELDFRIAATRTARQERASRALLAELDGLRDVASTLVERAEHADDVRLQRYAALTRGRTERVTGAATELAEVLALPDQASTRSAVHVDLRAVLSRAVASARAATGSPLLEQDVPDTVVLVECDAVEVERAVAHLLVTALSHSDGAAAVHLRLTTAPAAAADADQAVLTLQAVGTRVPTGQLSRVVARLTSAGSDSPSTGAQVQVVRGAVVVRSGPVEARSSTAGTSVTVRWPALSRVDDRLVTLP